MTYQYSGDNGRTWTEFNDHTNLRQAFISTPENKTYQVRALYRGELASSAINVELETPIQLPNSGMEDWQATNSEKFYSILEFSNYTFYRFYPYALGETDIWWATNNERSIDYSTGRHQVTSASCVSYTTDVHGGEKAALIYTSGHGQNYADTKGVLYTEGSFAGKLFIGNYAYSNHTGIEHQGHEFLVRPTAMKFWCKYIPKGSDSFLVKINMLNGEDVIATGEYMSSSSAAASTSYEDHTITLDYIDAQKSATSIRVEFVSTTKTSFSASDFDKYADITFPVMGKWKAHIGSKLYIDDISLIYDK